MFDEAERKPVADKTMTLRLPEAQAEALETVAEIEGLPVVEVVRLAVGEYIDNRRRDPSFQDRLQDSMERVNRARDRLRWPDAGASNGA
ncbi:MAG TPA: hypothetical protein VGE42_02510 [Candidatus Dormibacteraeota bacterium]